MGLAPLIRIAIIRFFSIFYFKKRSKAIFYHDIHSDKKCTEISTPIELFKKHIKIIIESGYEIVPEITNPIGQIEISFDDGFLGLFDNVEVINELEIPITLFIITSFFNKDNYMNREKILRVNQNKFIDIASHTHGHTVLNRISDFEIEIELSESKTILERILVKEVDRICFPEGKFSKKVVGIATELGYKKQYCSIPGFYFDEFMPNVKKRSLVQFAEEKEFKAILKGGDHVLSWWYRLKHFKK